MKENRWQQIEQIFNSVAVLPSAERQNSVEQLCENDFELRREVLLLLENDSQENSFLDESVFSLGAEILDSDWLELLKKERFGNYHFKKLLGRGGMGAVFLAEDTRLGRLVAVKVLPTSVSENTKSVEHFRREARAASGISHPNVGHIYEFGEFGGRWFLAMEYVAGKTLRELLDEESLSETSSINIIRQIANALSAMHRRGIVHRDIKPENIIVTENGNIKILDFGVARLSVEHGESGADSPDNFPDNIAGTAVYMSPEQISGKETDARTDLWSLGIVFFETLAGARPFESETAIGLQMAILHKDAIPIDLPPKCRRIINKLLEKNVDARYQNADEVLADLARIEQNSTGNHSFGILNQIKKSKTVLAISMVALFSLLAIGFRIFSAGSSASIESAPIYSIAVLPFSNENGGEHKDYLSDGLTDSLINKLSRLSNLSVRARGSTFKYKNRIVDARAVGRELSVQAVLMSRVVEEGERLTLNLKMFDAQTGNQIWSKQYNRAISDLVLLENEIARDVSHNLRSRLSSTDEQTLIKKYTENPEAFQLYLKGRFHWNKRTEKDLQKSIEYFEQAIALDANFALAYAALADDYVLASGYAISTPQESFPKAKTAALKALEIDRTLAEAHTALAYVLFNYEWNFSEAEKEIKLAIELNPNYATAHQWYGNAILLATGRFEPAIAELKLAQQLDPLSLIINADLGTTYLFARQVDNAIYQLRKTIEMDENFSYAHAYLGRSYLMKNDYNGAVREFEKAQSFTDDPRVLMLLARTYFKSGKKDAALKSLEKLKKKSEQKYVSPYYFALVYAGFGEKDKAFEWLEKAFQVREGRMTLIKVDPLMDEIRADPRFEDLQRRVGL